MYIHVFCLGISNKIVAVHTARTAFAHAVLAVHCNYYVHVHVIVVSWFLQCMGYVPCEPKEVQGSTITCTVKNMRQLTCTERPCKATARLASVPEYSMYYTL